MKVLVCGGRDYAAIDVVYQTLDKIHQETPITRIVEGGAQGADRLAWRWAIFRGVKCVTVEADWIAHGKAAGPIRNKEMLALGPNLVVAFPGGKGTADMVRQARVAGVEVREMT